MREKRIRLFAVLLAFTLVVSLLPGFASLEVLAAEESGSGYSARMTKVDFSGTNVTYAYAIGYSDQGIYCAGSELIGREIPEGAVEEYEGQFDVYAPVLLFVSYDGSVQKLAYTPYTMEREHTGKYSYDSECYMQTVEPLPDGSFAELAVFSESWNDDPTLTREDDEFWQTYHYSHEYYLRHLNADGTEASVSLIPTLEEEYIGSFSADAGGNAICAMGNKLLSIDMKDGVANWITNLSVYPDCILSSRDGSLGFTAWADEGMMLYPVDAKTGAVSDPVALPSDAYNVIPGSSEIPLCYSNGSNFFGVMPGSREKEVLFNWLNLDVAVEVNGELYVKEDGTVIGLADSRVDERNGADGPADLENLTPDYQIFTVSRNPDGASDGKTHLTFATPWLDYDKRADVLRFNLADETYHIDLLDYSVYNTDEQWDAGIKKLQEDLLSGDVTPDLIALNSLDVPLLAEHGVLEDLYPHLDASGAFRREDFFPNVLAAAELDGKLYTTVSGICINTLLGKSEIVGEHPGWTYRDFRNALSSHPGAHALSIYTTASEVFGAAFALDFNRYVDLAAGTCSFENGDFLDLLTFAGQFPLEYDWSNYSYETDSDQVSIANGSQLLYGAYLANVYDALYFASTFDGSPYTYIGYPVSSGTGNCFILEQGFGIGASSANKGVAWRFLSRYFTAEYQQTQYYLPSNRNALQAKIEEMMQVRYRTDADGNPILDEAGEPIPEVRSFVYNAKGEEVPIYALSQQDADRLLELIETTTRSQVMIDGLNTLVEQQADAFFRGGLTAEQAAEAAQKAVEAYFATKG
mgnify:FL=1